MSWRARLGALVLSVTALAGGCAGGGRGEDPAPPVSSSAPITNVDPCAMRLHDLSGALLAYWAVYYEFPAELSELSPEVTRLPVPPTVCPVSEQPYIYDRDGILMPERTARVILYDPRPSHSNMRWTITVEEPEESGLPITKVIALPERFFLLRPPG